MGRTKQLLMLIIPDAFPNTINEPFIITSPETTHYNCIAWAFEDDSRWYWPDPFGMAYWPENIPRTIETNSFIELYKLIRYSLCENGELEIGIQKIAIFTDNNSFPTHAARQLLNGFWTSKLGEGNDVQHTLFSISNGFYGNATVFMSRKTTSQSQHPRTK